jgi:hypothetical protein
LEALRQEQQEFFIDDEVWLKNTPQGTLRLKVVATQLHNMNWYLKLQERGKDTLYRNGAWISQRKVSNARRGPNHT